MVVLVILIVLVLSAPFILQLFRKDTPIDPKALDAAVAILQKAKTQPTKFHKKAAPGTIIELNSADTTKLMELNGIGSSFARRIISYRDRLGGFYKKEQLKEVFGLDSEKYAGLQSEVSVDPSKISKIHINAVTFEGLSRFPYLSFKQMNAIIQFREQHGEYESISDLGNVAILDQATLQKIKPYITFK
jgi:competence protein ComEA